MGMVLLLSVSEAVPALIFKPAHFCSHKVISFLGLPLQVTANGMAERTNSYFLTDCEATSVTSGCWQRDTPLQALGTLCGAQELPPCGPSSASVLAPTLRLMLNIACSTAWLWVGGGHLGGIKEKRPGLGIVT